MVSSLTFKSADRRGGIPIGPARITASFTVLAVLLMTLLGSNPQLDHRAAAQEGPIEEDFYYNGDERISVLVHLNELGVVGVDGVVQDDLIAFVESAGEFTFSRQVGDRAYVFELARADGRASVIEAARFIRAVGREGGVVQEAGLVITPVDDPTPMFVTDELIAHFEREITRGEIDRLNAESIVEVVRPDTFLENSYLLTVMEEAGTDALTMSRRYHEYEGSRYAHPNFWLFHETFQTTPNDPLYANQWHHDNGGGGPAVSDADVDTNWAWDITTGDPGTLIAIADSGIDLDHEDLTANIYTNPGEIAGNGVDDDSNNYVDDVNGWDFISGDNNPNPSNAGESHGTSVSGVAAARGDNSLGVSGSCPECTILPLRLCCTSSSQTYIDAFGYAATIGAEIMNNSWGHKSSSSTVPTAIKTAIDTAASAGVMIFFAGGNGNTAGWCGKSYPSIDASVVAVSSTTNWDQKVVKAAFGNCIDIMAPSHRGYAATDPYTGSLNVTTADRTGAAGYNNASPPPIPCLTEPTDTNYTNCFGGTSSASPLTAGVAGLVLSANPSLNRSQAQRLLQDTADKTEPGLAEYSTSIGYSAPGTNIATRSWGRLNALEAVRVTAATADGGKGGVDIFIRDNRLDWGNTTGHQGEQKSNVLFENPRGYIGHWRSVDIKVDAPPYSANPTTAAAFEAFQHENPVSGELNRVHVRVRNRGHIDAKDVDVKLHWAFAGTGLPGLPSDFWTAFPADSADTSKVHPLGVETISTLPYSGASAAGCPGRTAPACLGQTDNAQIVHFDFPGPPLGTAGDIDHFCLFAVIDSALDPIDPLTENLFVIDQVTPRDNNVTHRNLKLVDTTGGFSGAQSFFVRNPYGEPISTRLRLVADDFTRRSIELEMEPFVFDEPFEMEEGREISVTLRVESGELERDAEVTIIQERLDTPIEPEVMGGMTYLFHPPRGIVDRVFRIYLPLVLSNFE